MDYCKEKPYELQRLKYDYNSNKPISSTLEIKINSKDGVFMFMPIPKDIDLLNIYKKTV